MARVLGLDLGRMSGWANAEGPYLNGWAPRTRLEGPRASNEGHTCGEWNLGKHADYPHLYANLWKRLDEQHALKRIDVLAYESAGTRFLSDKAIFVVVGLWVVCGCWCVVNDVEPHSVHNKQMKRHAAGNGNCEKEAIMEAAQRLGWEPPGEDAADACFVLDMCLTECHRR